MNFKTILENFITKLEKEKTRLVQAKAECKGDAIKVNTNARNQVYMDRAIHVFQRLLDCEANTEGDFKDYSQRFTQAKVLAVQKVLDNLRNPNREITETLEKDLSPVFYQILEKAQKRDSKQNPEWIMMPLLKPSDAYRIGADALRRILTEFDFIAPLLKAGETFDIKEVHNYFLGTEITMTRHSNTLMSVLPEVCLTKTKQLVEISTDKTRGVPALLCQLQAALKDFQLTPPGMPPCNHMARVLIDDAYQQIVGLGAELQFPMLRRPEKVPAFLPSGGPSTGDDSASTAASDDALASKPKDKPKGKAKPPGP